VRTQEYDRLWRNPGCDTFHVLSGKVVGRFIGKGKIYFKWEKNGEYYQQDTYYIRDFIPFPPQYIRISESCPYTQYKEGGEKHMSGNTFECEEKKYKLNRDYDEEEKEVSLFLFCGYNCPQNCYEYRKHSQFLKKSATEVLKVMDKIEECSGESSMRVLCPQDMMDEEWENFGISPVYERILAGADR